MSLPKIDCTQFDNPFGDRLQSPDSKYSTGKVNNQNTNLPAEVAKIIDDNPNSGKPGTVNAAGTQIQYSTPAGPIVTVLDIPASIIPTPDTSIGWVQYFIARACMCMGDHITNLAPAPAPDCANNNKHMALDLDYFNSTHSCDTLLAELTGCLTNITTGSDIFQFSGTTLKVKESCPTPMISSAIAPLSPSLSLDLANIKNPCKIPVVLIIFLYYGAAYWRAHCFPQATSGTDRKDLSQDNLDQILAGFKA